VSSTLDRNSGTILLALVLSMVTAVACGGGGYPRDHQGPPPEDAPLNSISVYAHSTPSIAVGGSVNVLVDGYYDVPIGKNSFKNLTKSANWISSNDAIATVTQGTVTGTGIGSATITATVGAKTGLITVVVGLTPFLAITPDDRDQFSLSSNPTQQFQATATYSDGTVLDLTIFALWAEKPEGVLAFDVNDPYGFNPGLATFLTTGTTTVTATLDTGDQGTKVVRVVP
jgi:hypothetical protein